MPAHPMTTEIVDGVRTLLDDYAAVNVDDRCVIAYTPDSREPAAWVAVGLKARGVATELVVMRPLVDDEFAARIEAVLPDPADVSGRLVVFTLERDTMSHFEPLKRVIDRFGVHRCQVLRVISASPEFFTEGLNLTPAQLTGLNAGLLAGLNGTRSFRVKTDGGTDLEVDVDEKRFDWISNRGVWRPGGFTILPAGEIATYPARINGRLVADGAVNCNIISRLDMRLERQPLVVDVQEGVAVDFKCDNDDIRELVRMCFDREYGRRVGELGFGTNRGVSRFVQHNSHINERHTGIHLGFGQHNQPRSVVPYITDIHLDLITNGARVYVDGQDGVIDLDVLTPASVPHPESVRDEDIVEDCCGFGYGQLLSGCDLGEFAPPVPVEATR